MATVRVKFHAKNTTQFNDTTIKNVTQTVVINIVFQCMIILNLTFRMLADQHKFSKVIFPNVVTWCCVPSPKDVKQKIQKTKTIAKPKHNS